jgi:hypothetical protein
MNPINKKERLFWSSIPHKTLLSSNQIAAQDAYVNFLLPIQIYKFRVLLLSGDHIHFQMIKSTEICGSWAEDCFTSKDKFDILMGFVLMGSFKCYRV